MAEEMTNKTISYGVLVVAKPLNRAALLQAIRMGKAMHGRMMHMKAENDKLQKKLEELRCVSRAKCILIEREQYTEEQAHRYIEKLAMDTRRNRRSCNGNFIPVCWGINRRINMKENPLYCRKL